VCVKGISVLPTGTRKHKQKTTLEQRPAEVLDDLNGDGRHKGIGRHRAAFHLRIEARNEASGGSGGILLSTDDSRSDCKKLFDLMPVDIEFLIVLKFFIVFGPIAKIWGFVMKNKSYMPIGLILAFFVAIFLLTGCPTKPTASSSNSQQGSSFDTDEDGIPDASDNCPNHYNPSQVDTDENGFGNTCDTDDDGDGALDTVDNCPLTVNHLQLDIDEDGRGDECDEDMDGDGVDNEDDNCPTKPNADQADQDDDGVGDACDEDVVLPDERFFTMSVSPNAPEGMTQEELFALLSTMVDGVALSHFVDWDGTKGTYALLENLVSQATQSGLDVGFAVEVAADDVRRKIGPLPESFTNPQSPDYIPPDERNFANETLRQIITDWCVTIARDFQPGGMMVGVETNMYYLPQLLGTETNPDGENFVSLYKEIHDDIKQPDVSPDTSVFTTFQYERMSILELLGLSQQLQQHWDYVAMFDGFLDAFSISTFPVAIPTYLTPESIPNNYFSMIPERTTLPVVIAETGWPSSGSSFRSEEAQERFVFNLLKLLKDLDVVHINWFFLTDPTGDPGLNEDLYSSGLLGDDGTQKQIFDTWQDLFEVEYTESITHSKADSP